MQLSYTDIPAEVLKGATEAATQEGRPMVIGHHEHLRWGYREVNPREFIPYMTDVVTVLPQLEAAARGSRPAVTGHDKCLRWSHW